MGRRETKATSGQGQCSECGRRLPRSAFPKSELSGAGGGRCRDCVVGVKCSGCQVYLGASRFDAGSRVCRTCSGNTQLDLVLQTPKDEVTHCGALRVQRLEREAEYALLLVCTRRGLHDQMLLRKVLSFLRVPYITSQNGLHYCELCDTSFSESPVAVGARLRMTMMSSAANWTHCPRYAAKLRFTAGETHVVNEVRKVEDGTWFFKVQAKVRGRAAMDAGPNPSFMPLWAPVSATDAAGQPSPLAEHLACETHRRLEDCVGLGTVVLVSQAALKISKQLQERVSLSLSRFKTGLGLVDRFCTPADVEQATCLERVRDAEIPAKFLRAYAGAQDRELVWMSRETLSAAMEAYEQKQLDMGKRSRRASGRDCNKQQRQPLNLFNEETLEVPVAQ